MKSLFIISISFGIFSTVVSPANAQSKVNSEGTEAKANQNATPKFIVDRDITNGEESNASIKKTEQTIINQPALTQPSVFKPGFVGNIELCTALQFKYAMILDIEVESITNLALYNFIEQWWATQYKYGGSDRSGIDCSSFTNKLLSEVYGLNAPRTAKDQFTKCEKIAVEDLSEGNLVFFNTSGGVSHVGVFLGNNYFVHSSLNGGVTISNLSEHYYSSKFISGGKIMIPPTPLASN